MYTTVLPVTTIRFIFWTLKVILIFTKKGKQAQANMVVCSRQAVWLLLMCFEECNCCFIFPYISMLPLDVICPCLLFQFLILIFSEVSVNNYTFNEIKANEALKPRDLLLMDVWQYYFGQSFTDLGENYLPLLV